MAILRIASTAAAKVSLENFIADYVAFTSAQNLGEKDTYEFAGEHFMFAQLAETQDQVVSLEFAAKDSDDAVVMQATITGLNLDNSFIGLVQDDDPVATLAFVLSGEDTLIGGKSKDQLRAYDGADRLDGKKGDDVLTGGDAADTFVFRKGYDRDKITDFAARGQDADTIEIAVKGIDTFKDLKGLMSDHGKDVWIDFGGGDRLIVQHVEIKDLKALHFDL